jgi:hypothetical protein
MRTTPGRYGDFLFGTPEFDVRFDALHATLSLHASGAPITDPPIYEAAGEIAVRWACEGLPGQGVCGAVNALPHPITGSKVVLTVAHLDHDPTNNDATNLRALCQRCHNRYDAPMRRAGIKARKNARLRAGNEAGAEPAAPASPSAGVSPCHNLTQAAGARNAAAGGFSGEERGA